MNHVYSRHKLFIFLTLISGSLFSQDISVDTSANWQQSISSILGGNCVQISNVQFSNNPASAAYFSNGEIIGLTEGIVLSSGSLGPFISSADTLLATSFSPVDGGDTLLEQYALQELGYTGNATSYDASRLQFNFVSPVDQVVTIRFVFASEEYPEYAPPNNSFFNDIFAFFVKEADSLNYQNIAVVPGTSLPVTISNINAVTNTQFYLESTGLAFAFDGFTTPLTATFTAQAGVMYNMIIAISDIGDSVLDSAVFLELAQTGSQSIHGKAYTAEDLVTEGNVYLYGFNTEVGAFPALDTASINVEGIYSFNNVEQGLYLVQCVPDAVAFPLSIPIYYPGVVLWEDAVGIGTSCDSIDTDGPGLIFNTGSGEISGTIGQDPNGGRLRSDDLLPYEGVNVFLQDSASGEWRGYQVSDVLGEYTFSDLGYGTYYVYPDVAGIPIIEARKVVIDELSPTAEGINFQMNEDGVLDVEGFEFEPIITLGENVEWTNTFSQLFYLGNNFKLRLGGDTLINDTLYTQVLADGILDAQDNFNPDEAELIGGFRQQGSVLYLRFLRDMTSINPEFLNKDILYFDSNWDVNDTLYYPHFDNINMGIIESKDTITLNGIPHTRWSISSNSGFEDYNEEFIMGIGNSKGLFNLLAPDYTAVDGIAPLNICYTDNSQNTYLAQELYADFAYGVLDICFLLIGGLNDYESAPFELYPNPGQFGFTINQENFEKAEIVVRDLSGREHLRIQMQQENQTFQLEFLDAGVYLIEVKTTSGASAFARWIKQ
jgi:hypothetical protein